MRIDQAERTASDRVYGGVASSKPGFNVLGRKLRAAARQRPVDAGVKGQREAERVGSIGDIALEKALPFDGANSGTASSSAEADSVSILTTVDAVVYDWDIATDRLTWSSNVESTLAGFPATALATGAAIRRVHNLRLRIVPLSRRS